MGSKFPLAFIFGIAAAICQAAGQVTITFPADRAVFQRDKNNKTDIYIGGYFSGHYDAVEARLVPRVAGEGQAAPAGGGWAALEADQGGKTFYGSITAQGGWYKLEVRGTKAGVAPVVTAIEHVGIGEVFVVAGQSNATGGDANPNGPGAKYDQVNSVNFQNYNNVTQSVDPYSAVRLPCPEYVHLDAGVKTAPFGNYAWCWGAFGDKLYEKLRVPVMIFNAGWSSTGIDNWKQSIDPSAVTTSAFGYTFPAGLPFGHLRLALNYYVAQLGVRAVLWHQGETDNYLEKPNDNTYARYVAGLSEVISASRSLSGKSSLAWLVARASRFTVDGASRVSSNVINAQSEIVNNNAAYPHVYPGPETDPFYDVTYRSDEIHFRGDGVTPAANGAVYSGLISLAGFWCDRITADFLSQSIPYTATAPPKLKIAYSGVYEATIAAPAASPGMQFDWLKDNDCGPTQDHSQQWKVGPGMYRLKVADAKGNIVLSPALLVADQTLPVTWKYVRAKTEDGINSALLTWATGEEHHASHFEIQRSTDAVRFNTISTTTASGNDFNGHEYVFRDHLPGPGIYYYRLKELDFDGTFNMSHMVAVQTDPAATVKVYPNPVVDKVTVESDVVIEKAQILNLKGEVLYSRQPQSRIIEMDLTAYPSGLYIVKINDQSIRIVK